MRNNVVDPHGFISRVKKGLPKNCAVMLSPFCDSIIAMKMQGLSYLQIEKFLITQGDQYRISAPTIWRNLKKSKVNVRLPYGEELAERWGGQIDLDIARELSVQILVQKERLDKLIRSEAAKQRTNAHYHDKRIKQEQETLLQMMAKLQTMMKSPEEAAEERKRADTAKAQEALYIAPEALDTVRQLILSGFMAPQEKAPEPEVTPPNATIN